MDTFIVSARKYRPQNFSTVVGQDHITTTLKNAIQNNQLAHAFLFCGPRGVGKTTCARILAKTINCEKKGKDGEACNKCISCVSFDNGSSFNIHELDAASNNSVDDIRSLTEQVRFAPQAGRYKVYIVDEVHMLSASAFNAFLKTLEEPPPFVIFILATTEKHKIIPTILSRCQIFDFKRITISDTTQHLAEICKKEEIQAEKTALHIIAQKSEGCLRDALSILDKIVSFTNGKLTYANTLEHLNILDEDYYFRMIEYMQGQKLSDALLLYDEINQKGFEGDILLEGLAETIRNILVSKDPKSIILLETAEEFKPKYKEAAQTIASGWLLASLNILSESAIQYKQAKNKRLFIELVMIKLAYLNQAVTLISEDQGIVKKKLSDHNSPLAFKALAPVRVQEKIAPVKSAPLKKEAVLILDEPAVKKTTHDRAMPLSELMPVKEVSVSLGKLSSIRKKIAEQEHELISSLLEINIENLVIAWNEYVKKLESGKNHSSVSYFKMATLQPGEDNVIDITVNSDFHKKFIEAERTQLILHLREYFKNPSLSYRLHVNESEDNTNGDKPLSTKEHFAMLTKKYPGLKALKDRLKLELDI